MRTWSIRIAAVGIVCVGASVLLVGGLRGVLSRTQQNVFSHPRYGFMLSLPAGMQVVQTKEGNASETDVFTEATTTDESEPRQFQIFATPYGDAQITKARLEKDIPGGTLSGMEEVLLGSGIRAERFTSDTASFGRLTEVWWIHGGFIYEATTPVENDAWLASILGTLRWNQ